MCLLSGVPWATDILVTDIATVKRRQTESIYSCHRHCFNVSATAFLVKDKWLVALLSNLSVWINPATTRTHLAEQRFGHRDKKFGTEENKGLAVKRANLRRKRAAAQNRMQNQEPLAFKNLSTHVQLYSFVPVILLESEIFGL